MPSHAKHDRPQCYNHLSEQRGPHEREDGKKCSFIASETGICETWRFDDLLNEVHTPGTYFISKPVVPTSSVGNIAYRLDGSWTITRCQCDRVGKVQFHTAEKDCDPTHSTPRAGIQTANTCSTPFFRKGELAAGVDIPQGKSHILSHRQRMSCNK